MSETRSVDRVFMTTMLFINNEIQVLITMTLVHTMIWIVDDVGLLLFVKAVASVVLTDPVICVSGHNVDLQILLIIRRPGQC